MPWESLLVKQCLVCASTWTQQNKNPQYEDPLNELIKWMTSFRVREQILKVHLSVNIKNWIIYEVNWGEKR
jgi:hypothetical protein